MYCQYNYTKYESPIRFFHEQDQEAGNYRADAKPRHEPRRLPEQDAAIGDRITNKPIKKQLYPHEYWIPDQDPEHGHARAFFRGTAVKRDRHHDGRENHVKTRSKIDPRVRIIIHLQPVPRGEWLVGIKNETMRENGRHELFPAKLYR